MPDDWDDQAAIKYLKDRGWTLTKQWSWRRPAEDHITTPDEHSAIDYLWLEWDFGGIENEV